MEKYKQHRDVDQFIEALGDFSENQESQTALLFQAVGTGDWRLVSALQARRVVLPDEPTWLCDMLSAFGDVPDAVQWLLSSGAAIDGRGPNDWTALHLACRYGFPDSARLLVEQGADINARTTIDGGWTPLMEACAGGKKDVVQFLLEHGADPEIWNSYEAAKAAGIAAKAGHCDVAALVDAWVAGSAGRKRAEWKRKRRGYPPGESRT